MRGGDLRKGWGFVIRDGINDEGWGFAIRDED
jgi:hypothetical protein